MKLLEPQENTWDEFLSHPDKPLRVHMNGVLDGTRDRAILPVAEVAALFHDLGKLNPNFQPKLKGQKSKGYSNHAYLSAHAFACFFISNQKLLAELGVGKPEDCYAVIAVIAHHHGHLPNFDDLLSIKQREALTAFLAENPVLPISQYLSQWLPHTRFDVLASNLRDVLNKTKAYPFEKAPLQKPLQTFLETQWSFASLIESDKRDAGDNKILARCEELKTAQEFFAPRLESTLQELHPDSQLNEVRTQIRKDALENLREGLKANKRTFSLTAPTGAGKTFMLLALADAIRRHEQEKNAASFGVIYGLPFLSITEQVEGVCRSTFGDTFPVTRLDSKAINTRLEKLQEEADEDPQKLDELLREKFSEETFDRAFVVTTFVQIFETLLSNRNARLLKLPNFARTIFLLDEIQALPPRLYTFFAAHLQAFCEKFDCYAIFSTATMPLLEFAPKQLKPERDPRALFADYQKPLELAGKEYFENAIFNRYEIRRVPEVKLSMEELAEKIRDCNDSCLVVLNTIDDTRALYELLQEYSEGEVMLLNTRFTPRDRRLKLYLCKRRLRVGQKVILISTQLIEAGVDIDFPIVFRDLCPLPNLVQCAGRCNRNGNLKIDNELARGAIWFFELFGENGKPRSELIYDSVDLRFWREHILGVIEEKELLPVQEKHFEDVKNHLSVGQWSGGNLVEQINKLAFHDIGKFRLIDEQFGEEIRYYIPREGEDANWEKLKDLYENAPKRHASTFTDYKKWQSELDVLLKRMGERVVGVRLKKTEQALPVAETIFGLGYLTVKGDYSFDTGLAKTGNATAIL